MKELENLVAAVKMARLSEVNHRRCECIGCTGNEAVFLLRCVSSSV